MKKNPYLDIGENIDMCYIWTILVILGKHRYFDIFGKGINVKQFRNFWTWIFGHEVLVQEQILHETVIHKHNHLCAFSHPSYSHDHLLSIGINIYVSTCWCIRNSKKTNNLKTVTHKYNHLCAFSHPSYSHDHLLSIGINNYVSIFWSIKNSNMKTKKKLEIRSST